MELKDDVIEEQCVTRTIIQLNKYTQTDQVYSNIISYTYTIMQGTTPSDALRAVYTCTCMHARTYAYTHTHTHAQHCTHVYAESSDVQEFKVQKMWMVGGIDVSVTTTFPEVSTQMPYGALNSVPSAPSCLTFAPCGERTVKRRALVEVTRTKPSISTATEVGLMRGTSPFCPKSGRSCAVAREMPRRRLFPESVINRRSRFSSMAIP